MSGSQSKEHVTIVHQHISRVAGCPLCFPDKTVPELNRMVAAPSSKQRFDIELIEANPISRTGSHWRVTETHSDSRVATCFDSDNARMVRDALNVYFSDETQPGPWWTPTIEVERMMREVKETQTVTTQISTKVLEGLLHDSLLWRKDRAAQQNSTDETQQPASNLRLADQAISEMERVLKHTSGAPRITLDENVWRALINVFRGKSADETSERRNYHCNICGGDVTFPDGAKPSVSIGPGNKTRLRQTDSPDDGAMRGTSSVETDCYKEACEMIVRAGPGEGVSRLKAIAQSAIDRYSVETCAPRGKPCTCPDTSTTACGVERGHRLGELWYCRRREAKASTPPCVWRGGCKEPKTCSAAGCCQQITLPENGSAQPPTTDRQPQ